MKLEELQQWCRDNLLNKKGGLNINKFILNQKWIKTHHPKIINIIINHTSFLDSEYNNISIHQRLYHLIHNIPQLKLCKCCDNNSVGFKKFNEGYKKYCSVDCRKVEVREQVKRTCQIKYGVDSVFLSDVFKDKSKETLIKKYGVDNIFKSDEFKYNKDINKRRVKSQKNTLSNKTEEQKQENSRKHRDAWNNLPDEKIKSIIDNRKNTWNKRTEEQNQNISLKKKNTWKNKSDSEIENMVSKIIITRKENGCFNGVSKISQVFFWRLYNRMSNNQKEHCYFHELNNEYKIYNYNVDFIVGNKIIEFYGDRWHANPNKYNRNDIPGVYSKRKSIEIWEHDNKRNNIIIDEGYEIFVVWASEVVKNEKEIINRCKEFININNI